MHKCEWGVGPSPYIPLSNGSKMPGYIPFHSRGSMRALLYNTKLAKTFKYFNNAYDGGFPWKLIQGQIGCLNWVFFNILKTRALQIFGRISCVCDAMSIAHLNEGVADVPWCTGKGVYLSMLHCLNDITANELQHMHIHRHGLLIIWDLFKLLPTPPLVPHVDHERYEG